VIRNVVAKDRQKQRRAPTDEVARKLLLLALRNIEKGWMMPPRTWQHVANQFAIMFGDRFTTRSIGLN
jgi:transposase-like protein